MNVKNVLIGIGIATIFLTAIAMFLDRSTDGWWGIFMGVVLVGSAFTLNEESEKS